MGFVDISLMNTYKDVDGSEVCGHTFDEAVEVSLNVRRGVLTVSDDGEMIVFPWNNIAKINLKGLALTYQNL